MRAKVFADFPKTGLGNLLLIWARAKVFAEINNLPLVTSSWWGFRWGAWIRREKSKRLYLGYFKESPLLNRIFIKLGKKRATVVKEPQLVKQSLPQNHKAVLYLFSEVVTGNDLFSGLREKKEFLRNEIYKMLHSGLATQLNQFEAPVISVHIRRGDFKVGNQITPSSFFINAICQIRKSANADWPVTVFTDAETNEIEDVLNLPGVKLAEKKADILDILLMSKSKVIVLSQSSTFSYWGAFLSDAVIILNKNDWQATVTGDLKREIRVAADEEFTLPV